MGILQSGIIAMVIASGFVTAAMLGSLVAAIDGDDRGIRITTETPAKAAATFVFCMFAGPYLVASKSLKFWRDGYIPGSILAFCGFISVLWSFCSGILVLQLLSLSGVVAV